MGPKFWELVIVLGIIVLLFGPTRLAGLGEAVGKAIREFRDATSYGSSVTRQHDERDKVN